MKVEGVLSKLTAKMLQFNQVTQAVQNVAAGFGEVSEAGLKLNTSITDLSAITGVTGEKDGKGIWRFSGTRNGGML
jgi:hypothetical protein